MRDGRFSVLIGQIACQSTDWDLTDDGKPAFWHQKSWLHFCLRQDRNSKHYWLLCRLLPVSVRKEQRRDWRSSLRATEDRMDRERERGVWRGEVCLFCPSNTHSGNWGDSQTGVCVCVIGVRGRCAPHGVEGDLFSLGDRACCHGAPRAIGGGLVQWGVSFIIENFLCLKRREVRIA